MPQLHEDPERFREALNFTEAQTAFAARLLEKDYYCTLLLECLAERVPALVFKGGTCLAKVHADFFRLSEDLDFVIPAATDSTRTERRKLIAPVKVAFLELPEALPCLAIKEPFQGANNSTQYLGSVSYASLVTGQDETIKIEVTLREPMLTPSIAAAARTVLLNPVTEQAIVSPVPVRCMSHTEAFAEKFRAALTRREVAIRDFYDLDYAVRRLGLRPGDSRFVQLVREKLGVPGNSPPDVSVSRLAALHRQLDSELKSVLRERDYREFDLERAFHLVADMADRIAPRR